MSEHFLHNFLKPKSIATYGANNQYGTTMGTMGLINIIINGYQGKIYPIHLKLDVVLGYKAYKSIADVPEVPDLVLIVLPPKVVPQIFRECGEKGVKNLLVISGGFRELRGDKMNTLTEEIIEIANQYGMRFIGPNCLGFYNAWIYPEDQGNDRLNMIVYTPLKDRGKFSLASQSGTLAGQIFFNLEKFDINVGKTISVGNEANIDLTDFLEYFKNDEETQVIGLYIEEIKRIKKFMEIAREISPKKPIIAIYGGGSKAGNRAINTHTGAMTGNSKLFDAMVKETGIIKTNYIEEFLGLASLLSNPNLVFPRGNRLGIITFAGGPGAMIANNAERKGLVVPEFSTSLQSKIRKTLPLTASCTNPIDVTFDMNIYNFYVLYPKMLMKSGEIDALIIYGAMGFSENLNSYMENEKIGPYIEMLPQYQDVDIEERMSQMDKIFLFPTIKASKRHSIPIFYINPQKPLNEWDLRIKENGGFVFNFWDLPIKYLAKICKYSEYRKTHS